VIRRTAHGSTVPYCSSTSIEGSKMAAKLWVRLSEDVDCGLRRGGWYEAVAVEQNEVVLKLEDRERSFPRHLFEVSPIGPTRWTVVSRAGNSMRIPTLWTKGYAVCPACRWRQLVFGQPTTMLCEGCYQEFEIDWDELYLKVG
jgi:hypothetical protein